MQEIVKRLFLPILLVLFFSVLCPSLLSSQASFHEKIILKGFDGLPLAIDSPAPYSPKKTCGACHDYERITNGYHFQQGRTDGAGKIVVSDTFDPKFRWNLSSGMYGKHRLVSYDSDQLAKKENRHFSDIDKSSFFFVKNCGPCHPGGGWGEYDRKGNLYYDEEAKRFGYELSGDISLLDGDYTSFSMGDPNYGSGWDKSGVSEADCLICHLRGYRLEERAATLRGGFFKYGPSIGAGWGLLVLSQDELGKKKADQVNINYLKKEVADFENLNLQIIKRPPDENCGFCHTISDSQGRGFQWNSETDIHKAKALDCVFCHFSNKDHNFAKGNTLQNTVRDDLDQTMYSCEDCHERGKIKRAPRHRHPFSPRHMKRLSCQVCHIPFLTTSVDLVYDQASTGRTLIYETQKFLSNNPLDPKRLIEGINPTLWYPTLREFRGKIIPSKSTIVIYWGDLDEKTNVVQPIPLWKVRELRKPIIKDDDGDGIPEINSFDEIKSFLKILQEKDKFGSPVAKNPVLIKGGFLYHLNKKGEVEKTKYPQAETIDFSISHNVVSGIKVIGSRGCKDCHSKDSPFFLRKILIDPYDEKGRPVYIENWERLGFDREKLSRLLLEP